MAIKHLLLAAFICLSSVYCQESAASPAQIAYAISQNYDQTGPGAQTEQTHQQANQQYSQPLHAYNNLQQVYSQQHLQPVYSQQLSYSQPQVQYPGIQSLVGRYQTQSQPQIYQTQPQTHHIQPQAYYAQSTQHQSHVAQPQTHSVQISHVQPTHPQVSYSHLSPAYSQPSYKDYSPQIKYTQIPQTAHIPQVKIAEPSSQYSQSYVMLQGQPISKGQHNLASYSLVDAKPVVEQQSYVAQAAKTAYSSPVALKTVYQTAASRPSLAKFSLPAQQYSYSH